MKRRIIKFNDYIERGIIIGLDIETITDGDNSIMAYCGIKSIAFKDVINESVNDLKEIINNIRMDILWNYQEIQSFLKSLINDGNEYIITIHNTAYEWSYFIQNVFNEEFQININMSLFKDTINKPLLIAIGENIKIVDSLKYMIVKLAEIGKYFNYPKGDIDYKKIKLGHITDAEVKYLDRDVSLTMLATITTLQRDSFFMKNKCTIPITSTGIIRHLAKDINNGNRNKVVLRLNKYLQSEIEKDTIKWRIHKNNYSGAYTHALANTVLNVLENVVSLDFTSSYPFTILSELYPKDKPHEVLNIDIIEEIKRNIIDYSTNLFNDIESFNVKEWYSFLELYSCEFIIQVDSFEIKKFNNKYVNEMPLLSESKVFSLCGDNVSCKSDNGRIIKSYTPFNLICTTVDLIGYLLMYDMDFTIVSCLKYDLMGMIPQNIRNLTIYCYDDKMKYKNFRTEIERLDESLTIDSLQKILEKYDNISALEKSMLIKSFDTDDFEKSNDTFYQNRKANVNGIYGTQAQKPINSKLSIKDGLLTVEPESNEDIKIFKNGANCFLYGILITAYARFNLTLTTLYAYKHDLNVHYWDTDSMKITGDTETIETMIEWYNSICDKKIKRLYTDEIAESLNGIGFLENEGCYDKFVAKQCKQYITIKHGKLKATISGLPSASKLYKNLLTIFNNNFEKMVYYCFNFNTIFSPTVTNKLYSCYTNIEHVNKYGYHNGIILKPVPLELSNLRANCEIENLSLYSNSQYVNNINYSVETGNTKEVFRTDSTTIITLSRNGKIRIKKGVFNFGKCKKTKTTID